MSISLLCALVAIVALCYTKPPQFPLQVTFKEGQSKLFALDVQNQRALKKEMLQPDYTIYNWLFEKMPFAKPGTPQANNYVALTYYNRNGEEHCEYSVHWKYTVNPLFNFPAHWTNKENHGYSTKIGAYLAEKEVNRLVRDKDVVFRNITANYWRTTEMCEDNSGSDPCHQSYFIAGTEIPYQRASVKSVGWNHFRVPTNFTEVVLGNPKESNFVDHLPKNWQDICNDWEPKQMVFTRDNFNAPQQLTIRYKKSGNQLLNVVGTGGGYETVPERIYTLFITSQ